MYNKEKPLKLGLLYAQELYQYLSTYMVRVTGLEPAHPKILDPKSSASTSSATPASVFLL